MIPNTDLFHKALRLAAWAHYGQITKFGDPYVTHPMAAAYEVAAAVMAGEKANIDVAAITALLHDVVEKSDVTIGSIKKDFGKTIADGVFAMTKNQELPKEEQLRDSLVRILEQPKEIAMAKLGDRISSMLPPPPEWSVEKLETITGNARMILQMLGEASPFLQKRLEKKIKFYETVMEKRQ
ncbi:HD domain-containing protein [Hydrogenimonas cancrithermarum]|uniref:Phosphohydrolase n=1 Tax=Hydrogenimonas cancrithermarum TaxID=2993563 RepID=A0ABM8FKM0_9BACT|nr:HD domain-containing protein [Hydrogenimonas cancrithermarum]BDY11882.1 phosphohydrolase [Hydrogenimonas cancrithermarum]